MTAPAAFHPIRFTEEGSEVLVSIVIPMHGNLDLTQRCIETLREFHPDPEIQVIVVDDASPEPKAKTIAWTSMPDAIVTMQERSGFAKACNAGLEVAVGAYVILLNNDCESFRPWVWDLIRPLQERPGVGMVGALLLYPGKPPRRVQHGGSAFAGRNMPVHRFRGAPEDAHRGIHRGRVLQTVTGACLAMRTEEMRALGGLCADYQNGFEDMDLAFRLRFEMGKHVWYEPQAQLLHIESATPGRRTHEDSNGKLFAERWGDKVIVDYKRLAEEDAMLDRSEG